MSDVAVTGRDDGRVSGDGRHRRRAANREAVVNALLALFDEGELSPSAAQIAERAGLSQRSVFRYFDDINDLGRMAIARKLRQIQPLLVIDASGEDALAVRLRALATQRVRLFDQVEAVSIVSRLRAPFQEIVRDVLDDARQFLREQVSTLLAPELDALGDAAPSVLAVLDVLTSFECHQLLRADQGLSSEGTIDVITLGIERQLGVAV